MLYTVILTLQLNKLFLNDLLHFKNHLKGTPNFTKGTLNLQIKWGKFNS